MASASERTIKKSHKTGTLKEECSSNRTAEGGADANEISDMVKRLDVSEKKQSDDESWTGRQAKEPAHVSADVGKTRDRKWGEFGLRHELLGCIEDVGYSFPSPVQVESIPHVLKGRDLLVRSKNGTGKTASYIIPMLDRIDTSTLTVQAIILVPIRELALQISRNVKRMSKGLGIMSAPIVGGTSLQEDIIRVSNGVHVMVGTPGRVIDLIEKKVTALGRSIMLIFDEADKLLDITFNESVNRLFELLPSRRQILLYSATFPLSVHGFVKAHMRDPVFLNLMNELFLVGVRQLYAFVKLSHKLFCLRSLLSTLKLEQCIIFCNGIKTVELLAMKITEMGMSCYFIHSHMPQEERNAVFHNFTKGSCKILVATDLITRGVDVPDVNCVINFDFPKSTESYLHRVGRAGRFGRPGISISLITGYDKSMLLEVEEKLGIEILPVSDERLKAFTK
jgi:ATP-dependent RNA helicase DDX6/DHH1